MMAARRQAAGIREGDSAAHNSPQTHNCCFCCVEAQPAGMARIGTVRPSPYLPRQNHRNPDVGSRPWGG